MSAFIQNTIVIGIIAAAALYLLVALCRSVIKRRSGNCGGCHGCGASKQQLITLDAPRNRAS